MSGADRPLSPGIPLPRYPIHPQCMVQILDVIAIVSSVSGVSLMSFAGACKLARLSVLRVSQCGVSHRSPVFSSRKFTPFFSSLRKPFLSPLLSTPSPVYSPPVDMVESILPREFDEVSSREYPCLDTFSDLSKGQYSPSLINSLNDSTVEVLRDWQQSVKDIDLIGWVLDTYPLSWGLARARIGLVSPWVAASYADLILDKRAATRAGAAVKTPSPNGYVPDAGIKYSDLHRGLMGLSASVKIKCPNTGKNIFLSITANLFSDPMEEAVPKSLGSSSLEQGNKLFVGRVAGNLGIESPGENAVLSLAPEKAEDLTTESLGRPLQVENVSPHGSGDCPGEFDQNKSLHSQFPCSVVKAKLNRMDRLMSLQVIFDFLGSLKGLKNDCELLQSLCGETGFLTIGQATGRLGGIEVIEASLGGDPKTTSLTHPDSLVFAQKAISDLAHSSSNTASAGSESGTTWTLAERMRKVMINNLQKEYSDPTRVKVPKPNSRTGTNYMLDLANGSFPKISPLLTEGLNGAQAVCGVRSFEMHLGENYPLIPLQAAAAAPQVRLPSPSMWDFASGFKEVFKLRALEILKVTFQETARLPHVEIPSITSKDLDRLRILSLRGVVVDRMDITTLGSLHLEGRARVNHLVWYPALADLVLSDTSMVVEADSPGLSKVGAELLSQGGQKAYDSLMEMPPALDLICCRRLVLTPCIPNLNSIAVPLKFVSGPSMLKGLLHRVNTLTITSSHRDVPSLIRSMPNLQYCSAVLFDPEDVLDVLNSISLLHLDATISYDPARIVRIPRGGSSGSGSASSLGSESSQEPPTQRLRPKSGPTARHGPPINELTVDVSPQVAFVASSRPNTTLQHLSLVLERPLFFGVPLPALKSLHVNMGRRHPPQRSFGLMDGCVVDVRGSKGLRNVSYHYHSGVLLLGKSDGVEVQKHSSVPALFLRPLRSFPTLRNLKTPQEVVETMFGCNALHAAWESNSRITWKEYVGRLLSQGSRLKFYDSVVVASNSNRPQ